MPADDTTGPGGRTALTGFLTNADDSLRVVNGDTPPQPPQPARFVERAPFMDEPPSDEEDDGFDEEALHGEDQWADQEEAGDAYELDAAEEPDEADDLDWQEWQAAERSSGLRGVAVAVLILLAGVGGVAAIGWNLTHQKHDVVAAPQATGAPTPQEVQVAAAGPPPVATSKSKSVAATAAVRPARHTPAAEKARPEKLSKAKTTTKAAASKANAKATPKLLTKATTKPVPPTRGKAGVDCTHPQTVSRHMACDPALADANHQVGEAYLAAVVAGAPPDQLRSEQNDWLNVRDEAAKRSPAALADAYKARIDALDRQRTQILNEPPH